MKEFLRFPDDILVQLLSEWLTDSEWQRLDVAYIFSRGHSSLLEFLRLSVCPDPGYRPGMSPMPLKWMELRRVRPSYLSIERNMSYVGNAVDLSEVSVIRVLSPVFSNILEMLPATLPKLHTLIVSHPGAENGRFFLLNSGLKCLTVACHLAPLDLQYVMQFSQLTTFIWKGSESQYMDSIIVKVVASNPLLEECNAHIYRIQSLAVLGGLSRLKRLSLRLDEEPNDSILPFLLSIVKSNGGLSYFNVDFQRRSDYEYTLPLFSWDGSTKELNVRFFARGLHVMSDEWIVLWCLLCRGMTSLDTHSGCPPWENLEHLYRHFKDSLTSVRLLNDERDSRGKLWIDLLREQHVPVEGSFIRMAYEWDGQVDAGYNIGEGQEGEGPDSFGFSLFD